MKLTEQLAKMLRRKVRVVKGAGHFNEECGFTRFEKLLRDITKLLQ
jgi:predicted alpha/beta hydrolase family esterase